ncbi:MAG TPA: host attachment protein [Albitalea sp.]|nr:host attachment protein [Albitalea sp.]
MKHTQHTRTWILVANASKALCYERIDDKRKLNLLTELDDPLGRAKNSDLGDDRAGYEAMGAGRGSAAYSPRTDAKTKEHESFARKLTQMLDEGVNAHRLDALVIFASNPFLGELKSHLGEQASKLLTAAIATDLTSFDRAEILRRIDQTLHTAS